MLITGAGTGIGGATARAFAEAGAKAIDLCGKRLEPLQSTAEDIPACTETKIAVKELDVAEEKSVKEVFVDVRSSIGPVDICINCAGHLSDASHIIDSPFFNFWDSFGVNVKGAFLIAQQFLRHRNISQGSDPVLISTNSMLVHQPAVAVETAPANNASSKIAQAKMMEYVAKENPGMRCYSVQSGIISTEMSERSLKMARDPEESEEGTRMG